MGKDVYIDEFEEFSAQQEEFSCYNCEHAKVASLKYPCGECRNRDKWEQRKEDKQE